MRVPFPFFSKGAGTEGPLSGWKETNKECRHGTPADVALVSEGLSAQKPIRLDGSKKEKNPAGVKSPAGLVVDWTDEPYSDPRRSPRACLNRQAGFTAARPAAKWIPSSVEEKS